MGMGIFLLFMGAALLKFALYVADAPSNPTLLRLVAWMSGILAFGLVIQGTALVLSSLERLL